jgi:hypothetical protein
MVDSSTNLTTEEKQFYEFLSRIPIKERTISQQCMINVYKNFKKINNLSNGNLNFSLNCGIIKSVEVREVIH